MYQDIPNWRKCMKKFSKWYKRVVCILVISSLICSVSNVTEVAAETSEPFKDVVMETTLKSLASIFRQMKEDTAKDAEEVQEPEITVQPEVTQKPAVTAQPEGTPEPGVTTQPEGTPEPGVTMQPEGTQEPGATTQPEGTQEPAVTTQPEETQEPVVTPEPMATPEPVVTPEPTARPTAAPVLDKTPIKISVRKKGKDKFVISWQKRKSAGQYKLWQKKQGAKKWKEIKTTKKINYSVKIKPGRYYKYKVTAIYGKKKVIGRSETITACIPGDTKGISYKRIASRKISISWIKGKGAKKFIVYRKLPDGDFKKVTTVNKANYKDLKVAIGKKYVYKIIPVYENDKVKIYGSNTYIGVLLRDEVDTELQNYSYKELGKDINALKKLYGSRFNYDIIGQSADERNIYEIIIGNQDSGQAILVVAELHAREYMTSQLCMKQIEYYLQNYNEEIGGVKVSDVLRRIAIHYVPMANPDGAAISQYGFSAIRNTSLRKKLLKMPGAGNPSLWKANARGVDLNKNYPYEYVARQGRRGSQGYTGPKKCSESETIAIINLVNKLKKSVTVRGEINYHATGSIIFGDYEGPLKKAITDMYELACNITGYASSAGYSGDSKSVGNLREFVMYKKNLPSITLEIGTKPCPLPVSEFKEIWKKNKDLILLEANLLAGE